MDNSSGAIVTDLGTYDGKLVNGLQELDSILVESNHDVRMLQMGPYPFRLKNKEYGELKVICQMKHVVIFLIKSLIKE